MMLEYEACFMELIRYAPHLNTKNIKVNKFMFILHVIIRVKVRILMPQTLYDALQKALIDEEEMISGDQIRTPARSTRHATSGAQLHQTPTRHPSGYQGTPKGSKFMTPR
jgi:hypothetical protein